MQKYDALMNENIGFSMLKNNILTQASFAEKVFFWKYYKGNLYNMPEEMSEFCQRAYKGGLTDTFKRGEFQRVVSLDINSSYPF